LLVGEVPGITPIADDEELQEAEQGFAVAIAGIIFVLDNLLHGPARTDSQRFQLDLYHWHTIDEEQHVITVMAVVGINAELVDHLKAVFAPLFDVDQGVEEWRAVVALEAVALPQTPRSSENIRGDDQIQQPGKLCIGQMNPVKRLEFFAEVLLQPCTVADVRGSCT